MSVHGTSTATTILASLVRRYADGNPLPTHLPDRLGGSTPLCDWLNGLAFDHSEAPFDVASLLELTKQPPLVCECALTLRARLAERRS